MITNVLPRFYESLCIYRSVSFVVRSW